MSDNPGSNTGELMNLLKELCETMSGDPVTVREVKERLERTPFRAAVEAEPGSQAPAFARVETPASTGLTLEGLQKAFGPAKRLPGMGRGVPAEYLITVDLPGYPYTCALVIEKEQDKPVVEAVTVRRDIRLK
jgi:hypothetical protein